jgi:LmbE family N-acetylglucosaminyl deacetylase
MAVLAHPDDESLGFGGTLARYAAEGVEVSLVLATRGERGWHGDPNADPGPVELGRIRERELRAAASVLAVREIVFLDEFDGQLDRADTTKVAGRLVGEIRRIRPDVVVTFGPDGAYGHPDHIAISRLTTSAIVNAADAAYAAAGEAGTHRVSKLYHRVWTAAEHESFRSVFGEVAIEVDGGLRGMVEWPEWAIDARLDTADYWWEVQSAVLCHRSQISHSATLANLQPWDLRVLWGTQQFVRVMSTVHIDNAVEADLFAGLRIEESTSAHYDGAYVPLAGP